MPKTVQLGQGVERPHIAAIGCGGAGCNTLRYLSSTLGFEIIGLNDVPHHSLLGIKHRLMVSRQELKAVATLDDIVAKGVETDIEKQIARELVGFDLIAVLAGLGGNTGGDGANVLARVARLHNMTSMAFVTMPFTAEGLRRRIASQDSLESLRKRCPAVIAFANDQLLELVPNIPIAMAFAVMGQIMVKPLEAMARILTRNDVRLVRDFFEGCRDLRLGIGEAEGPHKSFAAVTEGLSSPWIKLDAERIGRAMVMISAAEIDEKLLKDVLHCVSIQVPSAEILWGSYAEEIGEKVRVSIIVAPL